VKLDFLEAMADHVGTLVAAGPTVVAGDLNIAPEDRDVWDPEVFRGATHVTPDERTRLAAVLEQGVADAFRVVAPDEVGFTWWDYRLQSFRRQRGMRIDLALVSRDLEVETCEVDTSFRVANRAGDKPSDHAPLVVTFRR
jgi:exodeoxyribonuclease III